MRKLRLALLILITTVTAGYLLPERIVLPVVNATPNDWNRNAFWFEPWGVSGVHKGIDIFAPMGTPVVSTTDGVVVFAGEVRYGGNVVLVLGPRWRLHYFAHLATIETDLFDTVASGEVIGSVGESGNAKGKAPHLHYSIVRLIPEPWRMDGATQGYKKAFYVDPDSYLKGR